LSDREKLVLVDSRNRRMGVCDKLHVHAAGLRHRAFSVFLVDASGSILLQKRHPEKYHSGGLWANTCCGHPRPGEPTMRGARRRLIEEVGVGARLTLAFQSAYAVRFENGLGENEIVNVYVGRLAGELRPHPAEVIEIASMTLDDLARAAERRPAAYAYWVHHYLRHHREQLEQALNRVQRDPATHFAARRKTRRTPASGAEPRPK
jgi:isopentenyl-diphosphate Delta-isomerase